MSGRAAGLDMRSLPLLLVGGKSGPALHRGSADKSLLYKLAGKTQRPMMPPKSEKPLNPQELSHLPREFCSDKNVVSATLANW